jgi:hypothetical protein
MTAKPPRCRRHTTLRVSATVAAALLAAHWPPVAAAVAAGGVAWTVLPRK